MKEYGFTEYETKVYVALLTENRPLNGNEISVKSGVPSGRVYETIAKLLEKEFIFVMNDGKVSSKKYYFPLDKNDLIARLNENHKENMNTINKELNRLRDLNKQIKSDWSKLYQIEGYEANIDLLQSLIEQSEKSILISGWKKEFDRVFLLLKEMHQKGVSVGSILFDNSVEQIPWRHYQHHQGELTSSRHLGEFVAVFDNRKTLFINLNEPIHGVVSSHLALVKIAENYIRHDIYINQIIDDFEEEFKNKYGENFEKILTQL